jgi:ABC-2 type transport system ATP-binding protein
MNDIDALTNKIILVGRGQILYNGKFSAIKEKYGHIKEIEVEFAKNYNSIKLDGYTVLSHNNNMATLKNLDDKKFNVKEFFNEITEKYEIVDFQVNSISVDEILAQLYTELKL